MKYVKHGFATTSNIIYIDLFHAFLLVQVAWVVQVNPYDGMPMKELFSPVISNEM